MVKLIRAFCRVYKWAIFLLLLQFSFITAEAQTFKYKSTAASELINGPALGVHGLPDTLTVWCNDWNYITSNPTTWNNTIKLKSNNTFVKFSVNDFDSVTMYLATVGYIYRLTYTIYGYYNPSDTVAGYTTLSDTLTISYNNGISITSTIYQDQHLKKYSNFYKAVIVLTGLYEEDPLYHTLTLASIAATPLVNRVGQNFFVEGSIVTQRYDKDKYGITADSLVTMAYGHEADNYLSLFWNYTLGDTSPVQLTPVSYELEWTYADDYSRNISTGGISTLSSSSVNYDFSNNSTRVWVDSNYYRIPLVYNSGYLIYRVRAVRPDSDLYKYPVYGKWSLNANSAAISATSSNCYYHMSAPYLHDSLNWQYTVSFAEGGKYKHVMSFYDGLLKTRQSITRFNTSMNKLIATQNIYDFEGHPSIKTLPTPIRSSAFTYQHDIALNSVTNLPYEARDFDTGFALCPGLPVIVPLATNAKASIYYSNQNPDTSGFNKFIPDAGGYPLVQTIFKPGYSGRVEHQGGAGPALQIGDSNTLDFVYTGIGQPEIDRLFGQDIGWQNYYTQTVSRDPNQQLSLSIKDYKGKQMVSALVGPGPNPTTHAMVSVDVPPSFTLTQDLLYHIPQTIVGYTKIADFGYFNHAEGFDSLQYFFSYNPFPLCPDQSLSVKAHFHYDVTDQCGDIILTRDSTLGTNGVSSSPVVFSGPMEVFSAGVAQYHVHKELAIDPVDVSAALDSFFNLPPNCFLSEPYFIRRSMESRIFPCPGTSSDPCENKKWQMMQELFPSAKYGYFYMSGDTVLSDTNSIFTVTSISGGKPFYRYQDTCTIPSLSDTITVGGVTYNHLRSIRADSFIMIYNQAITEGNYTIAEELLPLHPEYCELRACFSDTFKIQVSAIPDYKVAEHLNRLYLDSLIANDPLVGVMAASSYPVGAADSLRTFKGGHIRLDTFVILRAYCACSDSVMFSECASDMFQYEIANKLLINDKVKEYYFNNVVNLYFANRQRFVDAITMANGDSCWHCALARMTLIPMPIFDHTISSTGAPVFDSLSSYSSFAGSGSLIWFGSLSAADSMDSTMTALYDSAIAAHHFADSGLCYGQIDTILARLSNCIAGDTVKLHGIRNTLDSLCAAHAIVNGNYSPEQIRYAILRNCDSTSDLCNPYLVHYTYFPAPGVPEQNCKPDTFYSSVTQFINDSVVRRSFGHPGVTYSSILTPSSNLFEQDILNIVGNVHINVFSDYDSTEKELELFVFKDPTATSSLPFPDTVKISLHSPIFGNVFSLYFDSCSVSALCINTDPQPQTTGMVNEYSFIAKVAVVTTSTIFTATMLGWVDSVATMYDMNNPLSACVPCTQMRELYTEFMDTLHTYQVSGIDHPYYDRMLTSFMNYRLHQLYATDQYETFIESCALADSMKLSRYFGYSTFTFSTVADMDSFIHALNYVDSDYSFNGSAAYRDSATSGTITVSVNLNMIDVFELWRYKQFFNTYGGSYISKIVNLPFSTFQPPYSLGFMYVPTSYPFSPVDSVITDAADSVTYTSYAKKVWMSDHFEPVTFTDVTHTATAPPCRISKNSYDLSSYMYNHAVPGRFVPDYQSTINDDYFKTEKIDYLHYTYGYQHLPPYQVLDSIQANYLITRIPSYSGYDASYSNMYNPGVVTNLYLSGPAMVNRFYDTLLKMLYTVQDSNTVNPGYIFFDPNKVVVINEPDSPLIAYRCHDGTYWYRYFGAGDTLYNAFVSFPAYIPPYMRPYYQIVSIAPGLGDSTSRWFSLTLQKPGDSVTIQAMGLTTFVIGKNIELDNVLLGNPMTGTTSLPMTDTFNTCERASMNSAIAQGITDYDNYIDSIKAAITTAFTAYLMDSVQEQLILTYINQSFGYTLYNYDRAGNLTTTVPPMGVQPLPTSTLHDIDVGRETGSTAYPPNYTKSNTTRYNTINQPVFQQTINGGNTTFYYDPAGRLILSQNDKQLTYGYYTYNIYDRQNRVVETGQAMLGNPFFTSYTADDMAAYIRSFDRQDVVFTVYDTAAVDMYSVAKIDVQENLRKRVAVVKYFDTLLVADSAFLGYTYATHYSYDIDGNLKTLVQDFPMLDSFKQRYKRVDYDYDLISGKVNMLSYNRGFPDQFYHRYTYDADNRLTGVNTSENGYIWKQDAAYAYYDHGPLARIDLGDLRVQGIDYAYTIQGWLKSMNGDTVGVDLDMGQDGTLNGPINAADAVAYTIDYFKNEYKPITSWQMQHIPAVDLSLYNGNISRNTLAMLAFPRLGLNKQYVYDQFNRIKKADYAWVNAAPDTVTHVLDYASNYTYDLDGNILNLNRNGYNIGGHYGMDKLTYQYYSSTSYSDKLDDVWDCVPYSYQGDINFYCPSTGSAPRYKYDELGNTTMDLVNSQNRIEWNLYNKVVHTQNNLDASDMFFKYDGAGNRVFKSYQKNILGKKEKRNDYYVHDAQGNILAIYHGTEGYDSSDSLRRKSFELAQHDIYGSSRLGVKSYLSQQFGIHWDYDSAIADTFRLMNKLPWYSLEYQDNIKHDSLKPYGGAFNDSIYVQSITGLKQYELTDHLGNVLTTVSDARTPRTWASYMGIAIPGGNIPALITSYSPIIKSAFDYYPFGQLIPGRYMNDTFSSCFTGTIDEPVHKWMPISTKLFNAGCMPCSIDTINLSSLSFSSTNVTVIDTYRATMSPSPLPSTLVYGNWMMRYKMHNLRVGVKTKLTLFLSNVSTPDSAQFPVHIYNSVTSLVTTSTLPNTGPATFNLEFTGYSSGDSVMTLAIGWQRLYDTVHMPYGYSFTMDSLQLQYDTTEMLPVVTSVCSEDQYHYGYNGKYKDNEWAGVGNHYDYGFRDYDSRIARFNSIDPLTKKYPWYTPYQFAGNTPIQAVDLDGKEELLVIRWFDQDKYMGETKVRIDKKSERASDHPTGVQRMNLDYASQRDIHAVLDSKYILGAKRYLKNGDQFKGCYSNELTPAEMKELNPEDPNSLLNMDKVPGVRSLSYPSWPLHTAYFEYDNEQIIFSDATLNQLKAHLADDPGIFIAIYGYASIENNTQDRQHNQLLSERRAEAIENYLILHGIDPCRILTTKGNGGTDQFDLLNRTNEGINQNRRANIDETKRRDDCN